MLAMCAEKVLRLAEIDCSSPMSANTLLNTGTCEPSAAGISSPACAISDSSPAVLSATVLPPVFGPVITSTRGGIGGISRTSVRRDLDGGAGEQRMPRRAQFEPAVRRRSPARPRRRRANCARLEHVERRRRVDRAMQVAAAAAERIRQREQDAADFLRFLLLERDDVVVDLDGAERLEEQARAAAELPCTIPGIAPRCSARTTST